MFLDYSIVKPANDTSLVSPWSNLEILKLNPPGPSIKQHYLEGIQGLGSAQPNYNFNFLV